MSKSGGSFCSEVDKVDCGDGNGNGNGNESKGACGMDKLKGFQPDEGLKKLIKKVQSCYQQCQPKNDKDAGRYSTDNSCGSTDSRCGSTDDDC